MSFKRFRSWRSIRTAWFLLLLAPVLAWAVYAVREMLAVELILTMAVLCLIVFGLLLYSVGAVIELSATTSWAKARVAGRALQNSVREIQDMVGSWWHGGFGIQINK